MVRSLFLVLILLQIFCSCSCSNKTTHESQAVSHLRNQLNQISGDGILFGHQDDLAYGIGWKEVKGESDVKRVAGDYPALFGWEIGDIHNSVNLDDVVFDSLVVYIQRAHQMGGINTISWHARFPVTNNDAWNRENINVSSILQGGEHHELFVTKLDLVADFLNRLRDDNGKLIPVIFRPWHEMSGGWFWWGTKTCSNDEYIKLFRFTVDYLKHKRNLDNLLIAYAPSGNATTREQYLLYYPGDEYVDILGLDNYGDFTINRLDNIVQQISLVVDLATEKNKISAFTETGSDKLSIPNWYTTNLLQVLKANEKTRSLAYVMVWRNRDKDHFYVPYPEHEQADDFKEFTNNKIMYLLTDFNEYKQNMKLAE